MERLTNFQVLLACCIGCQHEDECYEESCGMIEAAIKKLADYEDKQEQGLLIELPSKVGDTVYTIHLISPTKHIVCEIENVDRFFLLLAVAEERFGKTVFLTRSEAEEALAKMGGK